MLVWNGFGYIFLLSSLTNLFSVLVGISKIISLRKSAHKEPIIENITHPMIYLIIAALLNSTAFIFLFSWRALLFYYRIEQLYTSFDVTNLHLTIYWLIVTSSILYYTFALGIFFNITLRTKKPILHMRTIVLLLYSTGLMVLIYIISGFFIEINYETIRSILGVSFLIGQFFLIRGVSREISQSSSSTKKARLEILRLTSYLLVLNFFVVILVSIIVRIYGINNNYHYFAISTISLFFALSTIVIYVLAGEILAIPKFLRIKYGITEDRFKKFEQIL